MSVLRAWLSGMWRIVRAPALLVGVYALTLGLTVPLGVVLHMGLPSPIDASRGDSDSGEPPDLDWLEEVAAQATGLRGTLSPSVIGVAAPLTNLGAVLDAERPPVVALATSAAYFALWAALWGGVIGRLAQDRALGLRGFVTASHRSWLLLARLGGIGLVCYLVLFLTVHALLFGPVYAWVTDAAIERTAFAWRVAFSVIFVGLLVLVSQVLDYARIDAVLQRTGGATEALKRGASFVRQHPIAAGMLVMVNGVLFGALVAAYGAVEFIPGGSVPRLSRVIVIGQAYILARLALRLLLAASQVSLYQRSGADERGVRP